MIHNTQREVITKFVFYCSCVCSLFLYEIFHAFLSSAVVFFSKSTFLKNSLWNTIRLSYNLDPDQAGHFVGSDLNPNCLQGLSADNTWKQTGRKCLKVILFFSFNGILEFVDTADMTVMAQTEHFMATDVEWDPTGRYVMTGVSWWGHKVVTPSSV